MKYGVTLGYNLLTATSNSSKEPATTETNGSTSIFNFDDLSTEEETGTKSKRLLKYGVTLDLPTGDTSEEETGTRSKRLLKYGVTLGRNLLTATSQQAKATFRKHLFQSSTVVHSRPEKLLFALIDPKNEMHKRRIEISKKSGLPTPRIVFGDFTANNKNNDNLNNNSNQMFIVASYLLSASDVDVALEFYHCYTTMQLSSDQFIIAFSTISPALLPPSVEPIVKELREDVAIDYVVESGWSEMGNYYLKRKDYGQTDLMLNFAFDASELQVSRILSYFALMAEVMESARKIYDRSDEVDEMARFNFINVTMPTVPELSFREKVLIGKAMSYLDKPFVKIPGTLRKNESIELSYAPSPIDSWGKAVGIVDTSAENCLAWYYDMMSSERLAEHISENDNVLCDEYVIPKSHGKLFSTAKSVLTPSGFILEMARRVFHTWFVWDSRTYNGHPAYVLAFAPRGECPQYLLPPLPSSFQNESETALGRSVGLCIFEKLAPQVTRFTFIQQEEVGSDHIPPYLLKDLIERGLSVVQRISDKFKRNGKEVDAELRKEFVANIGGVQLLTEPQKLIVNKCMDLEANFNTPNSFKVTKLDSKSPFVDMSMKMSTPVGSHHPVATGKVEAIIDTSPAEYVASIWNHCGNEKMRIHSEEKQVARLVVETIGPNEQIVATIERFKRPLRDREFVVRLVWFMVDKDTFILAIINEGGLTVDYGDNFNTVRGGTYGLRIVKAFGKVGEDSLALQCKVTSYLTLDGGGYLPQFFVDLKLPQTLNFLTREREEFNRDDQIDNEERDTLINIMKNYDLEKIQPDERALINTVVQRFKRLTAEELLSEIESPDPRVKMSSGLIPGEENIYDWAETEVDASIEQCASWNYLSCSREKMEEFKGERGSLERVITHHSEHCQFIRTVIDLTGISSVHPREWLSTQIWSWENSDRQKLIIVSAPKEDELLAPRSTEFVRAESFSLLTFEKMEALEVVGNIFPRTKVTFMGQNSLGGNIPVNFVDRHFRKFLKHIGEMRMKFDRSLEIDGTNRAAFVANSMGDQGSYSDLEVSQINQGVANLAMFNNLPNRKQIPSASRLSKYEIVRKKSETNAYGKASTVVRASPQQIIAYQFDFMARHLQKSDMINARVVKKVNNHNKLVYMEKVMPNPTLNREFLMRFVWQKRDEKGGRYVFVITPGNDESNELDGIRSYSSDSNLLNFALRRNFKSQVRERVKARYLATVKLTRLRNEETSVDHLMQLDIGLGTNDSAGIVSVLLDKYLRSNLKAVSDMQDYFQKLRPLDVLDKKDGEAIAYSFVQQRKIERKKGRFLGNHVELCVEKVTKENKALIELSGRHPWFPNLMKGMLNNHIFLVPPPVRSKMQNLSMKDAEIIGRKLSKSLKGRKTAEGGVDEWMLKHPAMIEMARKYPFFIPMCIVIGTEKVIHAPWVSYMYYVDSRFLFPFVFFV